MNAPPPSGAARYRSLLHHTGDMLYAHDSVIDIDLSPPGHEWTADTEYVFRSAIPDRLVKQYSLAHGCDDEGDVTATVTIGGERHDGVTNGEFHFLIIPLARRRADDSAVLDSLREQG